MAKLMAQKMVSMELDDEDKIDAVQPMPMPNKPDYPYGLRLCLTEKELKKLKLDVSAEDEPVGGLVHGHFIARITDFHQSDNQQSGQSCRIEMQIEDLAIESEDEENAEADTTEE